MGEIIFNDFLKKYCFKHQIQPEEAKEHKLVQEVKKMYEEDNHTA